MSKTQLNISVEQSQHNSHHNSQYNSQHDSQYNSQYDPLYTVAIKSSIHTISVHGDRQINHSSHSSSNWTQSKMKHIQIIVSSM